MSGIAGFYHLDGQPASLDDLKRMIASMSHRGSDGQGMWREGPVGFGHLQLRTTLESLDENQPVVNRTADLSITADARLDNRDELIEALDLGPDAGRQLSDSQLILAAYQEWADECVKRFLGDFAFAIWDGRRRQLFCARDPFGVKPFYYHSSDKLFAFSSEIKALFNLASVPRRLNELRVADYLAGVFADRETTFYSDVLRLPPGTTLRVGRDLKRSFTYWTLDPAAQIRLASDNEYAEAFRDIFREAVRCRLRSAFPVGSMLSGGLDSSSITCVARQLLSENGSGRLSTFSTVFDEVTQCDERRYIEAVLAPNGLQAHFIRGDQCGPMADLDRMHWHSDQPFYAPGLPLLWRSFAAARDRGVRVLLDGHDGDSVVSHGYKYLDELAAAGRWLAVAGEVRGLAQHYETGTLRLFGTYAWHYGLGPVLSRFKVARLTRLGWPALAGSPQGRSKGRSERPSWCALLRPEFVERTGLKVRRQACRRAEPTTARTEREAHYHALSQAVQPFALEVFDGAAAAHSIEPRYPFYDRRLVEFCLALPPEQKLSRGWTRMVLRRAMSDILPAEVQWRRSKTDFLPSFARNLRVFERERLDTIIFGGYSLIRDYVDVPALREAYQRFTTQASPDSFNDVMAIWKVTSLASWLEQNENAGQRREVIPV